MAEKEMTKAERKAALKAAKAAAKEEAKNADILQCFPLEDR